VGDDFAMFWVVSGIAWTGLFDPLPEWRHFSPLALAWYKLGFRAFGLDAVGWHAALMTLFVLATLLVGTCLRAALGLGERPAAMGALFFASCYAVYEPVAFVTTSYLLALVLFLLALLAWCKKSGRVSLALAVAAMLTSEQAVLFPAMAVLLDWVRGEVGGWRRYVAPFALATLYATAWLARATSIPAAISAAPLKTMAGKLLLLAPYTLCFNQEWLLRGVFSLAHPAWIGLLLWPAALTCLLVARSRPALALAAWILLSLLPVLPRPASTRGISCSARSAWPAPGRWPSTR